LARDWSAGCVSAIIRLTFDAANGARAAAAFVSVETAMRLDTIVDRIVMAGIIRHG
jgi:hypothetical protein